jgi:hypothetical protein
MKKKAIDQISVFISISEILKNIKRKSRLRIEYQSLALGSLLFLALFAASICLSML